MIDHSTINTPIGKISLFITDNNLSKISFENSAVPLIAPRSSLAIEATAQILNYFKDPHFTFDLPASLNGTAYQQSLWRYLATIPVGQAMTYGEVAKMLHSSPRAIGNACRHNPLPIIFPCHRVVAKNRIGGFAGEISGTLIEIKESLLRHEAYLAGD